MGASSWLGNTFGQNIYSSWFLFSGNPKKIVLEANWWEKMPLLGQGEHLYLSLNPHYHSLKGHCMGFEVTTHKYHLTFYLESDNHHF